MSEIININEAWAGHSGLEVETFIKSKLSEYNVTVGISGTVSSISNLPSSGTRGDAYLVDGSLYVWVGAGNGEAGTPSTAWANAGQVQGPAGVGFESVSSQQDGTVDITLTNGDTVTINLNHVHPQYPKYVYLTSESEMPANPDSETVYFIKESE